MLLTDDQIKRGTHCSVRALKAAINAYIDARKHKPEAVSINQVHDILASIQRFCQWTAVQKGCARNFRIKTLGGHLANADSLYQPAPRPRS
jgi:hypothetical protein